MSTVALGTGLEVASRTDRLRGLDSLRFIAAMWVVFSHLGFAPVFAGLGRSSAPGFVLNALMGVLFSGPAAVIVFFVISGFCIHHPYAGGQQFNAATFLIRRFVRIGIPMLAAIVLTQVAGFSSADFSTAILWSLVAELAYYALYPAIRKLMTRFDLNAIIVAAYAVSVGVALTDPSAKDYGVFGWKLNWLLGLPCWLLGVRVANLWASEAARAGYLEERIGSWRVYVWG